MVQCADVSSNGYSIGDYLGIRSIVFGGSCVGEALDREGEKCGVMNG